MDFVKYHKIIASGEEYDHVIVLDDERLISVKNRANLMAQVQESFMLYQSVIFNVYNLQKCVTIYANDTIELTDNCPIEIQDTAIIINTLITNILSSAKTLTDKMQAIMKKYYDDDTFLKAIADVYDSSCSYRLAQGLRNMCQHGFCVVSQTNGRYGIDLYQLKFVKDFTVKGSFKDTVNDLIERLSTYSNAPIYSLSALMSEYTTDVLRLYLLFLGQIRPFIEEMDLQLKCFVSQNPELLKHKNHELMGYLLISEGVLLHAIPTEESLFKTIGYFIKDVENQLLLFEIAEADVKNAFVQV